MPLVPLPQRHPNAFHQFCRVIETKKGVLCGLVKTRGAEHADLSPSDLSDAPVALGRLRHVARPHFPRDLRSRNIQFLLTELTKLGFLFDFSKTSHGSYGTVVRAEWHPFRNNTSLSPLRDLLYKVGSPALIRKGVPLAIKIEDVRSEQKLPKVEREARIHAYVSSKDPGITSRFYFSGFVPSLWLYVSVTQFIEGHPLPNKLSQAQFDTLENKLWRLWKLRIVHADLHSGNVLVDRRTRDLRIIDFGRAVIIPKSIAPTSSSQARNPAYQNELQRHVNGVIRGRLRRGNLAYGVESRAGVLKPDLAQYAHNVQTLRHYYWRNRRAANASARPPAAKRSSSRRRTRGPPTPAPARPTGRQPTKSQSRSRTSGGQQSQ